MKRPASPSVDYFARMGIAELDFTKEQLAAIGKVAMSYNETEGAARALCQIALGIERHDVFADVCTRINGTDGIVAITLSAAEKIPIQPKEMEALREVLGNGGFSLHKKYRDAVIHARAHNAPAGVGHQLERRGRCVEVLLTVEALELVSASIASLRLEMAEIGRIIKLRAMMKDPRYGDLNIRRCEEVALGSLAQYQSLRKKRLSLPPLPDFPSEAELLEAQIEWLRNTPGAEVYLVPPTLSK